MNLVETWEAGGKIGRGLYVVRSAMAHGEVKCHRLPSAAAAISIVIHGFTFRATRHTLFFHGRGGSGFPFQSAMRVEGETEGPA